MGHYVLGAGCSIGFLTHFFLLIFFALVYVCRSLGSSTTNNYMFACVCVCTEQMIIVVGPHTHTRTYTMASGFWTLDWCCPSDKKKLSSAHVLRIVVVSLASFIHGFIHSSVSIEWKAKSLYPPNAESCAGVLHKLISSFPTHSFALVWFRFRLFLFFSI